MYAENQSQVTFYIQLALTMCVINKPNNGEIEISTIFYNTPSAADIKGLHRNIENSICVNFQDQNIFERNKIFWKKCGENKKSFILILMQ